MLTAIETTGTINANQSIELDEKLPANAPERVRVIVLYEDAVHDLDERDWIAAAARNDVFEFLSDQSEDIYSLADGKPVNEE